MDLESHHEFTIAVIAPMAGEIEAVSKLLEQENTIPRSDSSIQGQKGRSLLLKAESDGAVDAHLKEASSLAIRPRHSAMESIGDDHKSTTGPISTTTTQSLLLGVGTHCSLGRDSNKFGMDGDAVAKLHRDIGGEESNSIRGALFMDDFDGDAIDFEYRTTNRTWVSRCIDGGFVVLGTAGAGMMSFVSERRDAHPWTHPPLAPDIRPPEEVWSEASETIVRTSRPGTNPTMLIASIAVTTAALTAYHYRRRRDKYQNPLIFGIAGGGALLGGLLGLDATGVLLRVVPWCVVIALVLSSTCSSWLSAKPHARAEDEDMSRNKEGVLGV